MGNKIKKGERVPGSGRKKGVPNKQTAEILEIMQKHNFNPAEALLYCYREAEKILLYRKQHGNLSGALCAIDRMEAAAGELAQYVFPKKKAIEHSGEVGVRTFADFIKAGEDEE